MGRLGVEYRKDLVGRGIHQRNVIDYERGYGFVALGVRAHDCGV